mmetsp:Transcript_13901/g.35924  ORF Transcript_13901/g.35924 Transcript_13901/m.35924 type:complete len:314 (+) Transcript_13901:113-1054(+)
MEHMILLINGYQQVYICWRAMPHRLLQRPHAGPLPGVEGALLQQVRIHPHVSALHDGDDGDVVGKGVIRGEAVGLGRGLEGAVPPPGLADGRQLAREAGGAGGGPVATGDDTSAHLQGGRPKAAGASFPRGRSPVIDGRHKVHARYVHRLCGEEPRAQAALHHVPHPRHGAPGVALQDGEVCAVLHLTEILAARAKAALLGTLVPKRRRGAGIAPVQVHEPAVGGAGCGPGAGPLPHVVVAARPVHLRVHPDLAAGVDAEHSRSRCPLVVRCVQVRRPRSPASLGKGAQLAASAGDRCGRREAAVDEVAFCQH